MIASILFNLSSVWIAFFLFLALLLMYLAGSAVGKYQKLKNPEAKEDGVGALEGALLGLLALLLSFTFSMTASRYDKRIELAVQEANHIGTVILRTSLYPDSVKKLLRTNLKQYLDTRLRYDQSGNSPSKIAAVLKESDSISGKIWEMVSAQSKNDTKTLPHSLMIPAVNDMIDVVSSRDAARTARVPDAIMWLLIILNLLGGFTIGYSRTGKKHDWIILTVYTLMTVATIFTIFDLDRPYRGLITTTEWNQKIVELQETLREP